MTDLGRLVRAASVSLTAAGVSTPHRDATLLAAHVVGVDPGELSRRMIIGCDVSAAEEQRFAEAVERRVRREPLQHITGWAPFRELTLAVGPGVFVPRPETELMVDLALTELRSRALSPSGSGVGASLQVVDLCTGSGAVALAIADEAATSLGATGGNGAVHVAVHAVELSAEALPWTRRNAATVDVPVSIVGGDATDCGPGRVLADLDGAVDVVVSNPPYIPVGAVPREVEVREYDPHLALFGGSADGLAIPAGVAARAWMLLRPGGLLVMEHADVQGDSIQEMLRAQGWAEVVDHPDLSGRPRHVTARRPNA